MATRRSRSLLSPTKKPKKKAAKKATKKAATKRRATVARIPTARERADAAIASIREAKAQCDGEYFEIGKALLALAKPSIWRDLYAASSLREFLDDYVMPHSSADRLMTIARSYSKPLALKIGLERSFQLARLAEADDDLDPPAKLWRTNVTLQNGKRVQRTTAAELQRLVSAALLKKRLANANPPVKAKPSDRSAVAQLKQDWKQSIFADVNAKFRFNPKKRIVNIEFHVEELFEDEDEE